MNVPGLRVQIRRHGVSRLWGYESCIAVDLCANGFAFRSGHLRLKAMQKVDFLLSLDDQQVEGTALIRHVSVAAGVHQYGAFVLRADRDLESLQREAELDSPEVEGLARRMAQELARRRCDWEQCDLEQERQKSLLGDAVNRFRQRMDEFGMNLPPAPGSDDPIAVADFVRVDRQAGTVHFMDVGDDDVPTVRRVVLEFVDDSGSPVYVVDGRKRLHSIFELLQLLSEAWWSLYVHGEES